MDVTSYTIPGAVVSVVSEALVPLDKQEMSICVLYRRDPTSIPPPAMQEPQNTTDSQLDSNGLDQQAINRYMDLASRRVLAPYRWTGGQAGLFAIADTGNQVSRQGIAIYLVKDGKTISYQLTPDERREFHDLMELDLNRSRSFTVEA
jgi:hypothetical protein